MSRIGAERMPTHVVEIALQCWFPAMGQADQPAALHFSLIRTESTAGSGSVDVHLRAPFHPCGVPAHNLLIGSSVDEIVDFRRSLQELHDTMEGVAVLEDTLYTDDSRVSFRVADRAAGIIEVDGRFYAQLVDLEEFPGLSFAEEESRFFGDAWGWSVGFRGFMVHRQALAEFVRQLASIRR